MHAVKLFECISCFDKQSACGYLVDINATGGMKEGISRLHAKGWFHPV